MADTNQFKELNDGFTTAFLDRQFYSNSAYRPEFISNDPGRGRKVLSTIDRELEHCDRFAISVAFITMGGVTPLLQTLKELEEKRIPGKILTTDYLTFSEPEALERLASLKNIELRMFCTDRKTDGFHTKGYIFEKDEIYRILIGSSNMTLSAVTRNKEWNTKITGTKDGEVISGILAEFHQLWESSHSVAYDTFIEDYRIRYEAVKRQKKIAFQETTISLDQYKLRPNKMQTAFIRSLRRLLKKNEERALLISATGTGKTYASAFGIREGIIPYFQHMKKEQSSSSDHTIHGFKNNDDLNRPFRVLFLVHREQIARQAMRSYQRVFGNQWTFGLLTGGRQEKDRDFIFSTVQTLSRSAALHQFDPKTFDILVIDEVHHAGAPTYQRVIDYFHPRFFLGMTATPERTDGYDIFSLFNHNIAYEIRLQQAMEEDLLCPFHYFGISDIAFDEDLQEKDIKTVDQQIAKGDYRVFNRLTSDYRVNYILQQADYFGCSGDRVKGLIFVSTKRIGQELSNKMNARGRRTVFLSGDNSQTVRDEAIHRLTSDTIDPTQQLDYIISVDIFGEGSDIPEINQVIMLRPTESAIVFVQQLGRGLRIAENKEYLVVLDFIGNYNSNFLIPVALSGDRTYNKDNMRKYIMEGASVIPGSSTIHFDRIAKERIFESINRSSTRLQFLKEKYQNVKNRLGHIPSILEFYYYGECDPLLILDYSRTYERFLRKVDKDYTIEFTPVQEASLEFISSILAAGQRPHELLIIQMLLEHKSIDRHMFSQRLEAYHVKFREQDYESAVRVLNKEFINTQSEKKRFADISFFTKENDSVHSDNRFSKLSAEKVHTLEIRSRDNVIQEQKGLLKRVNAFSTAIRNLEFRKALNDLLACALQRCRDYYRDGDEDNLVLYQKYSRKDVCRLLNWERDDSQTMYGYRIKYGTCPIFVTYEKKDDISESTKYEDRFINNRLFSWMTRSRVRKDSPEAQELIRQQETGLRIYLFVKKNDGEGTDFYYMGQCDQISYHQTTIPDNKGTQLPVMNFQLKLRHAVREDIYDYFEG